MSAENVEIVRGLYASMAAGEGENAFDVYDVEIEWDVSGAPWLLELGFDPVYRGHAGVRRGLRGWLEAWDTIDYEAMELVDAGDDVIAFVHLSARGRTSGVEVTYLHPQVWTVRDGKITRMRVFADREQALQAVGRSA
jgi:ketosteroid isomerase-like protein